LLKVVKHAKEEFSKEVELFAGKAKCSYLDALQEIALLRGLELEVVPKLITARLKDFLESEAEDLNLLVTKKQRLPGV
jgi:hypothetical protein